MSEAWLEDELLPRIDALAADLTIDAGVLPVAHPEWFRAGDIVRVGDDDLYDTGEVDDLFGTPIFRARNEAVKITDAATMTCRRALGANPARPCSEGERVIILGNSATSDSEAVAPEK